MSENKSKEIPGFPRGFDPNGTQGEYSAANKESLKPFIYNKPLIVKIAALTLLIPVAIFLDLYKKTGITILLISAIAYTTIPIYMWFKSSTLPNIARPDPSKWQNPSKRSASELIGYSAIALAMIAYASWQIANDEFLLPTKSGRIVHLGGPPIYLMAASFYSVAFSALTKIIDHWDERNNEHLYSDASLAFKWVACIAFGASFLSAQLLRQ